MGRRAIPCGILLTGLVLGLIGGCGPEGPERYEVAGAVTLKGKALEEGIITFVPQDGQGTQDGATIRDGQYRIPKAKGLSPGKYKVIIIGGDGTVDGGKGQGRIARPGATPGKERVPPQYNEKSTQIVTVTKTGPNQFEFAIP